MRSFQVPRVLMADAYALGHPFMIPPGMESFQVSQATYRRQFSWGDQFSDQRVINAGLLAMVKLEFDNAPPVTMADIDEAEAMLKTYHANHRDPTNPLPYPYDRAMWERVVKEFGGRLPICIMGMREGQAHYIGEPCLQVFTDVPGMGELVGHIESDILPYMWSSAAVATRGRIRKQKMLEELKKDFPQKSEAALLIVVQYLFHDFGRRGAPAAQITGIAHFLNFLGSDILDAAYAARVYLNDGMDFGASSILAGAHRTVTPWESEQASIDNMIRKFPSHIWSFVADSYGFEQGIRRLAESGCKVLPLNGGWLVGRPDSGDPVQCVIVGLRTFEQYFGVDPIPGSGLKVLRGCSILQGDGVSDNMLFTKLYPAIRNAGFSIVNVAIGMGEYNHRAVRSDLELGYKTCLVGVAHEQGGDVIGYREVMKDSNTDFKRSFPCAVSFNSREGYERRVRYISPEQLIRGEIEDFVVYYDGRPNPLPVTKQLFVGARELTWSSWNQLLPNRPCDTIEPRIRLMQRDYLARTVA